MHEDERLNYRENRNSTSKQVHWSMWGMDILKYYTETSAF